ncbi:MAG: HAMP domain-containing histidine kinase [Myxococcales bacterium]|nr:HAMP domain-containing histidine kinase [Myxococcales bacterium]
MARDPKRTDELPDSSRALREKYRDLAAKYVALIERGHQQWGYRIALQTAVRGITASNVALAVAQEGHIVFRNVAFGELERRSRWTDARSPRGPRLPLSAWALRAMGGMSGAATALRLRDGDGTIAIALRLERQRKPPAILIWAQDVTESELRDNELTEVRQSLIQQHRLLMLGEAAAAVAHDLGSTLRALAYRTATLRRDGNVSEAHPEALAALEDGLGRATATIQRLNDFARSGAVQLQPVDVKAVLRHAVALFQMELEATRSKVRIELSVPELPSLRAASADLSHLFLNLLRNASDAMPDGGAIRIRARVRPKTVVLVFDDEGKGLPPKLKHRLFEPFFTTKGPQGTGLGLWLAASTMRRVGGTIDAGSRKGGGTRFTLTFTRDFRRPADLPPPPEVVSVRPPASLPPRRAPRIERPSAGSPAGARGFPSGSQDQPAPRARAERPRARPRR